MLKGIYHWNWKGGKITKICLVCNKKFEVIQNRKNKAKYCSFKCYWKWLKGKKKMFLDKERKRRSEQFKGINNPRWKGGISLKGNYNSQYAKKWRKKNIERKRKYEKVYNKERRKIDIKFRLDRNISAIISRALKGKKAGRKWESLVGYTLNDLMAHLESLFETWMNWQNYGKWVIDHKKPKSLFYYETAESLKFKQCWSLENLQPLEKIANIKKSNHF